MIVSTMTPVEVYRELELDRDNLSRWWLRQRKVIAKRALKCTRFPMKTWIEWTSPRKNRYLVFNILLKRKYDKGNATGFIALQRTEFGTSTYTSWVNWQYHTTCNVALPHLYMRYSQRCNVMKTGTDLIKHFIERNFNGGVSYDKRFAGRSIRYKDKNFTSVSTTEGVMLGENAPGNIFVGHTFITYDMATGLQRKEFEAKKEKALCIESLINVLDQDYRKQPNKNQ
jgi:hypothetical protein